MSESRVENPPVVIDIGTRLTMIGFAGEDYPRFTFPTVVGYPFTDTPVNGNLTAEYYIGQKLFESIPLRLVYPVKAGVIEDWKAVEAIYAFAFDLLEVTPSESRIVGTKNVFKTQEYQKRTREMLFHDFEVSHLFLAIRSVLSIMAIGRRTGIVIDFEPDYVSIVPVYEGGGIPHAIEVLGPSTVTGLDNSFIAKQLSVFLEKIDSDIHNLLCNNIVLTGSSTTTPDFDTALLAELQRTGPSGKSFQIVSNPERLYLPWKGGSIFGKMGLYNEICMSRAEFEQKGSDVQ